MKKFMLAVLVLFSAATVHAQEGIEFFKGSFEEAKAEATESNKLIFMDGYATWCGPCKWMAKNVFTDDKVGEMFNASFVNMKMDMEKGEGPRLARIYKLRAYPTLFILDGEGKVLAKNEGALPAEDFLQWATAAVKKHNPELLESVESVEPESAPEATPTGSTEPAHNLEELIGAALWDKDESRFDELTEKLWATGSEEDQLLYLEALRVWAEEYKQPKKYMKAVGSKMDDPEYTQADVLNNAAWYGLDLTEEKEDLVQMANWTGRSIDLKPDYYNYDTFAHIMYALKEYKVAREYGEKALEIARSTGEQSEETQKLLAQIPD